MDLPASRKSGIYRILNLKNNKFYIGSAKNLNSRASNHRANLRSGSHENPYLQHAWNKYGEKFFKFDVVEFCLAEECLEHEQHWLDSTECWNDKVGYNIARQAGNIMGGRNHSEESKAKMKALRNEKEYAERHKAKVKECHWIHTPDAADIIKRSAAGHRGKKHTEEHKEKIGASHWKNRPDAEEIRAKVAAATSAAKKGKPLSEEAKANMAAAQRRRRARERGEIA